MITISGMIQRNYRIKVIAVLGRKIMNVNKVSLPIVALLLLGWSAPSGKDNGARVYGVIQTQQDNVFDVDGISLSGDGDARDLVLYEFPHTKNERMASDENSKKMMLAVDPKVGLATSKVDLVDIKIVEVPYPSIEWVYKKDDKWRETSYLEVLVSRRGKSKKKRYLIERNSVIYGKDVETGEKQHIPIIAIKTIDIGGYYYTSNRVDDGVEKKSTTVCTKQEELVEKPKKKND